MPLDRERLTKLLALTASDNDHEALGCIRAANRMLKAEKVSWAEVLAGPEKSFNVSIFRSPEPSEAWEDPLYLRDKVQIDLMLKSIYSVPRGSNEDYWRIMDEMYQSYQQHGRLTATQYKVIREAYSRTLKSA